MTTSLPDAATTLLDAPTYVTLTTITQDGWPHSTTMWVDRDGDAVLFSTVVGRAKERHLRANDKVAVAFFDPDRPGTSISIRGTATVSEEGAAQLVQRLSQKYVGAPYTRDEGTDHVRVVVRVTPTKVTVW